MLSFAIPYGFLCVLHQFHPKCTCNSKDKEIQNDFIDRIKGISYRYWLRDKMRGGIVVVDAISKRSSTLMLKKTTVMYEGIEK